MVELLSRNWGWIVLRGVVAILFGVVVILTTATSLQLLVLLFGIFALVDGVAMMISAAADRRAAPVWIDLLMGGMFGTAVGIAAILWPRITGAVLLGLIAAWAVVVGMCEIVAAIRLRKVIADEAWLIFAGILSVVVGVAMALMPRAGGIAIGLTIGIYATFAGLLMIVFGVRLRNWGRRIQQAAAPFLPSRETAGAGR